MLVLFKNSNDRTDLYPGGELYYGTVMTSEHNFVAQGYMDITEHLSLKDNTRDWKNSAITSASEKDIIAIYEDYDTMKHYNSSYFL